MKSLYERLTAAANTREDRAAAQEELGRADLAERNRNSALRHRRARWALIVGLDRADRAREVN